MFPVVHIHRWAGLQHVSNRGWRKAQQEFSEGISSSAGIGHRAARVAAIQGKSIHRGIPDHVATHPKCVFANDPCQGVSESDQILIQRTERIASAIGEVRKSPASREKDSRVTKGGKREWSNDRAIGIDITLIEANAGEKTFQGRIAMPQKALPVKATAHLVDFV